MITPIYCEQEQEHRLYHAIGKPCPCLPTFVDFIADMPLEEFEEEKSTIITLITQVADTKTAQAIMSQIVTGPSSQNLKDLVLELGKDEDLYKRIFTTYCPGKTVNSKGHVVGIKDENDES